MLAELKNTDRSFIIAEVGQNHQGDVDEALHYIGVFARCGADAVKFQTRNNRVLFDKVAYERAYDSENAFADTYGAHREKLELPLSALKELKAECQRNQVKFMSTPFDEPSLHALLDVGVDLLKVASFDAGNLPFLKTIGETGLPVVLSCGGSNLEQIKASVRTLVAAGCDDLAVLHCISEYPSKFDALSINRIGDLGNIFPDQIIGLSDHFNGILSGPLGFTAGARVFEKHVTFDRSQKGTDHSFALEPEGFRKFVRDIRRTPEMLAVRERPNLGNEAVFQKLGKSLIYRRSLKKGEVVTIDDLSGKILNTRGIPVRESGDFIGKVMSVSVEAETACKWEDVS